MHIIIIFGIEEWPTQEEAPGGSKGEEKKQSMAADNQVIHDIARQIPSSTSHTHLGVLYFAEFWG